MKKIKSKIKAGIKKFYPQRAMNQIQAEDSKLLSLKASLTDFHLKNTQVLPDRLVLLQNLPMHGEVAEIGVADGQFSEKILKIIQPAKFHLIDAWGMSNNPAYGEGGEQRVFKVFSNEIDNGIVKIHRGLSWEMLEELPDKSLDWVYIDAAHDFISVKKDLEIANRKVKDSGFIAGHDYTRWGRFGKRFGVLEAVNEFIKRHGFELAFITLECDYNWSYAIRKK